MSSHHIFDLTGLAKRIEKIHLLGIKIPDHFLTKIEEFNRDGKAFLQESQKQTEYIERNKSIDLMASLLWQTFFNNLIKELVQVHSEFPIYYTCMANKEHAKCVMADDIREKIRLVHEMLKSSCNCVVPPRLQDINIPAGYLRNEMLYASYDDGIEPRVGFVESPSLKPVTMPCSILDYLKSEYLDDNDYVNDQTVLCFARFARDWECEYVYDPSEDDPTFLSEVMEKHGSKTYIDVCREFPNVLSDYHPKEK